MPDQAVHTNTVSDSLPKKIVEVEIRVFMGEYLCANRSWTAPTWCKEAFGLRSWWLSTWYEGAFGLSDSLLFEQMIAAKSA